MSPDSPKAVEDEIWRLSQLLDQATGKIANRARKVAETDADYKVANAKAVLLARTGEKKLTVDEVEATAVLATQNEYRAKRAAEATLLSAQEAARNIRTQIEGMRSLAANQRFLLEKA